MGNSSPPRSGPGPAKSAPLAKSTPLAKKPETEFERLQRTAAFLRDDPIGQESAELEKLKEEIAALESEEYLKLRRERDRLERQKEKRKTGSALDALRAEIEKLKEEKEEEETEAEAEAARDENTYEKRRERQKGKLKQGFARDLSVEQAFRWDHSKQEAIGYITAMTIGTTVLTADYTLDSPVAIIEPGTNPLDITQTAAALPVVGVLKSVSWDLGVEDPISFKARISPLARKAILSVQYSATPVVDIQLSWFVYEYDLSAAQYYIAFSSNITGLDTGGTPIAGQIRKDGRGLDLIVDFTPADEVWAPQNFALEFSMRPKTGTPQELYLATSRLGRINKTWGQAATTTGTTTGTTPRS